MMPSTDCQSRSSLRLFRRRLNCAFAPLFSSRYALLSTSLAFSLVVFLTLPGSSAVAQDAVTLSNDSLQALARYEQQLEELETRYDSYHASLLEPLQAMAALLAEQGDYERVAELQNRQLQLLRTSLGFEHPQLIPALEAMIDTQLRLQNWQEVTDYLDHIRYLQAANHGPNSEQFLEARRRQSQWLLHQVFLDREANRAHLVLEAREILDESLDQAEEKYGEDNPALVPWLYRRALSLYYVVAMMNTDSGLSGRAIDEVARRDGMGRLDSARQGRIFSPIGFGASNRIPVVEDGEPIGVAYLRQALGFINDIEDIGEAQNDLELQGMVHLYHGDFHLLMDRGSGQRDYRKARERLLEAGIEAARIDKVLARPMPIPLPEFFTSFADLERHQQMLIAGIPDAEDNPAYTGSFTAWDEDLADVALPHPPAQFPPLQIDSHEAELEFRVNSRGQVAAVDVISVAPHDPEAAEEVERKARRALRQMKFRPAFAEGRTRTTEDARIRYRYYVREER